MSGVPLRSSAQARAMSEAERIRIASVRFIVLNKAPFPWLARLPSFLMHRNHEYPHQDAVDCPTDIRGGVRAPDPKTPQESLLEERRSEWKPDTEPNSYHCRSRLRAKVNFRAVDLQVLHIPFFQ